MNASEPATPPLPIVTEAGSQSVPLAEALRTWTRVAALSFGGPAGQIAVMHRIIVDEKKWISEERFLHALNYCMLLPGPEAQQLATYIGWLMHGVRGGLLAGLLFVAPGFLSILLLNIAYASFHDASWLQALFFGLKSAVLAIVVEAVFRIGRRVIKNRVMVALAACSFIAIFFFGVPFPALIVAAGLVGYFGGRLAPSQFVVLKGHAGESTSPQSPGEFAAPAATVRRAVLVSVICLTLWFGPQCLLASWLGTQSVYVQEGVFFSRAAVVTFGGAYSVLAYIAQQAVEHYGWLQPGEMLDGLGMAETTPGPLIMVVQFVGFLGAFRHPDPLSPLAAGIAASVLTTWVTFVPCFYWIFLGAPYVEGLRNRPLLTSALSAVTAAVVGVVLNLAVWFALHTIFRSVQHVVIGPLQLWTPDWTSIDLASAGLAALACGLMFYWKRGMAVTLAICCNTGLAIAALRALLT